MELKTVDTVPAFISHEAARVFYKGLYGKYFCLDHVKTENDVKFYVYHLIKHRSTYIKNYVRMKEGKTYDEIGLFDSYKIIEISQDGYVYYE